MEAAGAAYRIGKGDRILVAQVIAQDGVDQPAGPGQDLFGQVDRLIDGSRLGDAVEIQQLVQSQAQKDQHLRLQARQRLGQETAQDMVQGALATKHPEDQFGKQAPVRAAQLSFRQLAIHELIGVTTLFLDSEENGTGRLARIGWSRTYGAQ